MEFTLKISSRGYDGFYKDFHALMHYWKRDVKVTMTKQFFKRVLRNAKASSQFSKFGHLVIETKNSPKMEIIYNLDTLEICEISFGEKERYRPTKVVGRNLTLDVKSPKKT